MKVLFIQNIEGIAGSEKYFWALLPALKQKGVEVEFLAVHKPAYEKVTTEFLQPLATTGITVHHISSASYTKPALFFKINRLIKKQQPDILHTHLIYADFWAAILKSFFGLKVKTVSTLHGYQEDIYTRFCMQPERVPKNNYYRVARYTYKRLDHVYSCSNGLKEFFTAVGIQTKKTIEVIHHGFDYPSLPVKQKESSEFICTIVGRLIPRKGHELVLKNCKLLADNIPGFRLLIVGGGHLREPLEKMAEEQNAGNFVTFTGDVNNPRNYMMQSAIVLVPSYAEGLPLVIFEAMSVCKPVVAFNTIGPAEVVLPGKTGYLVDPFNTEKFAETIIALSKDNALRSQMGNHASELLQKNFSLDAMTKKTLAFYQTCLK